jgi:hypothetical protein
MKLQSQLRSPSVSMQDLIGYVQDQQGPVPSYLALAELSRRKELNAASAQQQAPAPTQSVAQQEVAQAQPEPGIANLPLQNPEMFSEQSMAAGGIVAFSGEDGSDVSYNRALQGSFLGRENLGAAMSLVDQYAPDIKNLVKEAGGVLLDKITGLRWVRNPNTGELQRASDVVEAPNAGKYADMGPMGGMQSTLPTGLGSIPTPFSSLPSAPQAQGTKQNLGYTGAAPVAEARVVRDAQPKPDGGSPMRGYKPTDFSVPEVSATQVNFDPTVYERLKEKPVSAEEEMARYKAMIGENEGLAGLKTRLTGMEDKAAREEEQAPWMALARAGLAMAAGKSQNALQNIAEGAGVGLSDYTAAKERLANKEEKRFDLQTRMAAAERAEQVAAATFGENSAQHIKAQNRLTDLAAQQARTTVETTNASNALKAEDTNARNKLTAKELGMNEKHFNDTYNVQMKQAEKSLIGIEKQGMQQQTAILNNLLDEANARVKALASDFSATAADKIAASAKLNAIQNKLMDLTGVNYTSDTAAPAGPRKKPLGAF